MFHRLAALPNPAWHCLSSCSRKVSSGMRTWDTWDPTNKAEILNGKIREVHMDNPIKSPVNGGSNWKINDLIWFNHLISSINRASNDFKCENYPTWWLIVGAFRLACLDSKSLEIMNGIKPGNVKSNCLTDSSDQALSLKTYHILKASKKEKGIVRMVILILTFWFDCLYGETPMWVNQVAIWWFPVYMCSPLVQWKIQLHSLG